MNNTIKEFVKTLSITLIISLLMYGMFHNVRDFTFIFIYVLNFIGMTELLNNININWKVKLFSTLFIFFISVSTIVFLYGNDKILQDYLFLLCIIIISFTIKIFISKRVALDKN